MSDATLAAARAGDERAFGELIARYDRELRALCYRMSGSIHYVDDLMQEVMLRAWKGLPAFNGEATIRTWLFKISVNTCLSALAAKKRRILPTELGSAGEVTDPMAPIDEPIWLEPCPEELYVDPQPNAEMRYGMRESVELAFLTALQVLPARQRALVLLHDVLGWSAGECAELLEMSRASVNSALQRARETLEARPRPSAADDAGQRALLERYMRAWEAADLKALVTLLHEDATISMPPIPVWLRGVAAIEQSMGAMVFASAVPGTFRTVATHANGEPAVAVYRRSELADEWRPFGLHLVSMRDEKITSILAFLDPSLFRYFGLPESLGVSARYRQ